MAIKPVTRDNVTGQRGTAEFGSGTGGASGSAHTLVFDSAGVAGGNVYTAFGDAITAANSLEGPVVIEVRSSDTISSGTYDLSDITFVDDGQYNQITFDGSATASSITNLGFKQLYVEINKTTPFHTFANFETATVTLDDSTISCVGSASGYFTQFGNGVFLTLKMFGSQDTQTLLDNGGVEVIDVGGNSPSGGVDITAEGLVTVGQNVFAGSGNDAVTVYVPGGIGNSGQDRVVNRTQTNFSGSFTVRGPSRERLDTITSNTTLTPGDLDAFVPVDSSGGTVEIDLPDPNNGRHYQWVVVLDENGSAATNNITVVVNGGAGTFAGGAEKIVLNKQFQTIRFFTNEQQNEWQVEGFAPGVDRLRIVQNVSTNQNDFVFDGIEQCAVLAVNCTSPSDITGLNAARGAAFFDHKMIVNTGASVLTLKHADSGSIAANRFTVGTTADVALETGDAAWVVRNGTPEWQVVAVSGAGGGVGGGSPIEGILTEDLEFIVDAKDIGSYDGQGNTSSWVDLISGVPGSMNGVTTTSGNLNFDGTSNRVEWSSPPTRAADIFSGGGTAIAWIRVESDGGGNNGHILDTTAGSAITGWRWECFTQNANGVKIRFRQNFSGDNHIHASQYATVPLNQWCQVAVTYSGVAGEFAQLWVNGGGMISDGAPTVSTGTLGADGDGLTIGAAEGGATAFDGDIDLVALYDRVLTREELLQNYRVLKDRHGLPEHKLPAGIPQSDLRLYVDLGDKSSWSQTQTDPVVYDLSATRRTGGISGTGHTVTNSHFRLPGASGVNHIAFDKVGGDLDDLFNGGNGGTVLAWIRPTSDGESNEGRIVGTEETVGTQGWSIHLSGGDATPTFNLRVNRATSDTQQQVVSATTQNEWVCVAATYDSSETGPVGNTPVMYINGSPGTLNTVAAGNGAVSTDAGTNDGLLIGDVPDSARMFGGDIEIVALWDRALSQEEITQVYNETSIRFTGSGGGGGSAALPASGQEGLITHGQVFLIDYNDLTSYPGDGGTAINDIKSGDAGVINNPNHGRHLEFSTSSDIRFSPIPADAANIFTSGGTIQMLIRMDQVTGGEDVLIDTTGGNADRGYRIAVTADQANGVEVRFNYRANADSTTQSTYSAFPKGKFAVLSVQFDDTSLSTAPKIWVNTAPMELDAWSAPTTPLGDDSAEVLVIGAAFDSSSDIDGAVEAVIFYNRELDRKEIAVNCDVLMARIESEYKPAPPEGIALDSLVLSYDFVNPRCYNGVDLSPVVRDLSPERRDGQLVSDLINVQLTDGYPDFLNPGTSGVGHIGIRKDVDSTDTDLDDIVDNGVGVTWSFWVNLDDEGEGANEGRLWTTAENGSEGNLVQFRDNDSSTGFVGVRIFAFRATTDADFIVDNALKLDEWGHIAITYLLDESPTVYVNGVARALDTDTVGSGAVNSDVGNILRLCDDPAGARMVDGQLGELHVWKRKLTAGEVRREYERTKAKYRIPVDRVQDLDATVQTTDATITVIEQVEIPVDDTVVAVTGTIIGADHTGDDTAFYNFSVSYYRNASGTITEQGSVTVLDQHEDVASWDFDTNISAPNVEIRVQGAAATTIEWRVKGLAVTHG